MEKGKDCPLKKMKGLIAQINRIMTVGSLTPHDRELIEAGLDKLNLDDLSSKNDAELEILQVSLQKLLNFALHGAAMVISLPTLEKRREPVNTTLRC